MAENRNIEVGGRLHSIATGNVIAGANEIFDDDKNKKQSDINTETYSLVNDVNERLSGLSPDQQSALSVAAKATNNETKLGYYVCDTEGNLAAKVISNATGYVLSPGGSMKVKMTNANTAADATLNINSTGAKPLFYDGVRASVNNTWDANEVLEIYYDGTNYQAYNIAGGSGDGVFDVSKKYPTSGVEGGNTYTLEGALYVLNTNLPASKKKGGMSIKFVQSSDNKYVQYRLMSPTWSTAEADWQGVDVNPTRGSKNLVESGGVKSAFTAVNNVLYGEETLESIVIPEGGRVTFDTITLNQNGDALEFQAVFKSTPSTTLVFSAFTGYNGVIAISLANNFIGAKNSAGTWIPEMNGSQSKYQTAVTLSDKIIKLVYEDNVVHLYIDGVRDTNFELSTQPEIKINQLAYDYVLSNNHYNWSGTIKKFNYTHNSETVSIEEFVNFAYSGGTVVNMTNDKGLIERVGDIGGELEAEQSQIDEMSKSVENFNVYGQKIEELGWYYKFNGTSSEAILKNNIVLKQNGDSVEFGLVVNETGTNGYAFATGGRPSGGAFGIMKEGCYIAFDDSTVLLSTVYLTSISEQIFKIEYSNGDVVVSRNGTVIKTYTGQKDLTIKGFGHGWGGNYGYWDGTINYIKVNGTDKDLINIATLVNLTKDRDEGFLTDEQAKKIQSDIVVVPINATKFYVKTLNRSTGKYLIHEFVKYVGNRTVDNVEYNSLNLWTTSEIFDEAMNKLYQGNLNFIYSVGSVNNVSAADMHEEGHVGGNHGCCVAEFTKFFVDGKEIDIDSLTSNVYGSTFRAIWKLDCYVIDSSKTVQQETNFYPKIVEGNMILNGINYSDAVYKGNGEIEWHNRFVQKRDGVKYRNFNGSMCQGYTQTSNNIMLNDVDNSWNEFVQGTTVPTFSEPAGYNSDILYPHAKHANTVIMWGTNNIIHHSMEIVKGADHRFIYCGANNGTSVKCYLQPIYTTAEAPSGITPDTLNDGDVIEVFCKRKVEKFN